MPGLDYYERRRSVCTPDYPSRWRRGFRYVCKGDSIADDTATLQAAIDDTHNGNYDGLSGGGGGTLRIAEGIIKVNDTIHMKGRVALRGSGRSATQIRADTTLTSGKFVMDVDDSADSVFDYDRWTISDLCINGNRSFGQVHGGLNIRLTSAANFSNASPDCGAMIERISIIRCMRSPLQFLNPNNLAVRAISINDIEILYGGMLNIYGLGSDLIWKSIYCWTGSDYATFTESGNTLTITGGGQGGFDWVDHELKNGAATDANGDPLGTTKYGTSFQARFYVIGLDASNIVTVCRPITDNAHSGSNPTITYSGTAGSFVTASTNRIEVTANPGVLLNGAPQQILGMEVANMRGSGFLERSQRNNHVGIALVDLNGDGLQIGNSSTFIGVLADSMNRRGMASGNGGLTNVSGVFSNAAGAQTHGVRVNDRAGSTGATHFALRVNGTIVSQMHSIQCGTEIDALVSGTPGQGSVVYVVDDSGTRQSIWYPTTHTDTT